MLHVIINGTRYNLATADAPTKPDNALVRAAQAVMLETDVTSATVMLDVEYPDESEGVGVRHAYDETGDTLESEYDEKVWAFAEALGCSVLSNIGYDGRGYGPDVWTSDDEPGEYWVLDDSEREQAASNALDSYLEECVLEQIPEAYHDYFDGDRWKEDALAADGYGHTLSSYDGEEHGVCIDGTYYYVYRVN
jgi:hypothetical protein